MTEPKIKVILACDGFGEDLKNTLVQHLQSNNISTKDLGCDTYYDASAKVAKEILLSKEEEEAETKNVGVLVCGTGMGVGMIANKFPGIRAATCENMAAVRCARAVNDANVLCLGQLVTSAEDGKVMMDEFLKHEFIARPNLGDGGDTPAPWWNENVEDFLKGSMEGIQRVEKDALNYASS